MNIYIFLKLLKQYDSLINLLHEEDIYRNADVSFVIIIIPQAVVPTKEKLFKGIPINYFIFIQNVVSF